MRLVLLACLAVLALPVAGASAAKKPYESCGDTEQKGVLIGDVSARNVPCSSALKVARALPAKCGTKTSCSVSGYSCFSAKATDELRLARCSKASGGDELYRVIRFDWGS